MPVWLHRLWLRARAWRSAAHDRELHDELQMHLELLEDEYRAQGAKPDDARRLARRDFGNPLKWQEASHELFSIRWLDDARRDLSYAFRMMLFAPGFTLLAVVSLAIGIGGTTAAFSLLDGLFWRPLPVRAPQQLVIVNITRPDVSAFAQLPPLPSGVSGGNKLGASGVSVREFHKLSEPPSRFSNAFLWLGVTRFHLAGKDSETEVIVERTSADYFSALDLKFEAGRPFGRGDTRSDSRVTVISHRLWLAAFNGDQTAIGQGITLRPERGDPFTAMVVGVVDRRFSGIEVGTRSDVWLLTEPVVTPATPRDLQWWGGYRMMVRLQEGESADTARSEFGAIYAQALQQWSAEFSTLLSPSQRDLFVSQKIQLQPGGSGFGALRAEYRTAAIILTISAVALLLIACANVAALLLARGIARQSELSVRLAIGGDRPQIVRQLLCESLALAAAGGGIGLAVAYAAVGVLRQAPPVGAELPLSLDIRTLAVAAAVSLVSAGAFGLVPALSATRINITSMFKGLQVADPRRGWSLKDSLVATQIALSVILLFSAGLLARSYVNLLRVETGFAQRNVVLVTLNRAVDVGTAIERLASIPGVDSASAWRAGLLRPGMQTVSPIYVDGVEADRSDDDRTSLSTSIARGFFETVGVALLAGRSFSSDDAQRNVAVVTAAWAKHFVGTVDAVGRTYRANPRPSAARFEIIGVAEDIKYRSLREDPPLVLFRPLAANTRLTEFVIRSSTPPSTIAPDVRSVVRSLDPDLRLAKIDSMDHVVSATLTRDRVLANFAVTLSFLATALAAVGLYGTLAYAVRRRTNEIGLRMALGAAPMDIVRAILPRVAGVVASGVTMGLLGSLMASRYLANQLFGLTPADFTTTIATVVTLTIAAGLASYLPLRRASRVDPMTALRYE